MIIEICERTKYLFVTRDLSFFLFYIIEGFDSAACTHAKQDQDQNNHARVCRPLDALEVRMASAPWGDTKSEGTRWRCTRFVVITFGFNMWSSLSVSFHTKNVTATEKKNIWNINQLLSLHTWGEIWEFLPALRAFFTLLSVSALLGVGSVWIIAARLQMCPTGHSRQDYFRD